MPLLCSVYRVRPDELFESLGLAALERCVTASELAARQRFTRERDFRVHVAGRALLRCLLAERLRVPPAQLTLVSGSFGKPELGASDTSCAWRFSVSGTDDLVVAALCEGADVGIDVERHDRPVEARAVAAAFLEGEEARAVLAAGDGAHSAFLRTWTLKEAYLKARGEGLTIPLDRFRVRLDGERANLAWIAPALADRIENWRLQHVPVSTDHFVALAVRAAAAELRVSVECGHAVVSRACATRS